MKQTENIQSVDNPISQSQKESKINYMELWSKMLEKWYLFAIVVAAALVIAYFVNRYSAPKYEAEATLLIKTNNDMLNNLSMGAMMARSNTEDFENAIGTIQSNNIAKSALKAMDMYVSYYTKKNLTYRDVYKDAPFTVILDISKPQATGVMVNVKMLGSNKCEISYDERKGVPVYDYVDDKVLDKNIIVAKTEAVVSLGQWFEKDGMRFKLELKENMENRSDLKVPYCFTINNLDAMAVGFNSTRIENLQRNSSIVKIKFKHTNPKIAVDFVNMLCKVYIDQTFEEKNYLNTTTIEFVNNQILAISDSLSRAESRKEAFKEANNTLNLTNDGEYLLQKTNQLQEKRAEEYSRQQYYSYLTNYIKSASIDEGVASPAAVGVNDPVLTTLVSKLAESIIAYKTALTRSSDRNPRVKEIRVSIETIRNQIGENLASIKEASNINMRELQRQQKELQSAIDRLPSTERSMISIERQFKFNDDIYSFLYQKRADAEIAKNAALPDHKIVDKASVAHKVYPQTSSNFLVALLLGLLLPGAYVFIKYITKDVVEGKDDLQRISSDPILGFIPEFPEGSNPMMVFNRPKSMITEAYRTLRTNIKYVLGTNDEENLEQGKTILVTSSMPNEGKSLTAVNIASVFSITKSKVLLIECDLRKPRLHKTFDLDANAGITAYYIGKCSAEDIVQHTEFDNFDVVCVGQVSPNPSEIIDSKKMMDFIDLVKKQYDYIILDTPPVNLIADAITLAKHVDTVLYIVRSGVTRESLLGSSLVEIEQRGGIKVNFVLNGIQNVMQKYGYGKGYVQGYGKGYGYGGGYGYTKDYAESYGYGYFDNEGRLKSDDRKSYRKRKQSYRESSDSGKEKTEL